MKINSLEVEWTDEGCRAKAHGFERISLACPRCHALLSRGVEHLCGNFPQQTTPVPVKPKRKKRA